MGNEISRSLPLDARLTIVQSRDKALDAQLQGFACESEIYQQAITEKRPLTSEDQLKLTQCKDRALEGQLMNIGEERRVYQEEAEKISDALTRNTQNSFKRLM